MGADDLVDLVDRHAAALTLYARQWTDAPDDVVQTAFLKLVRLPLPPDNPVPWLYTVVRNAARDAQRAARRRTKYETRRAEQTAPWFAPSDDPTGLDGQAATDALATLSDDVREIVIAHLWGGLTFEQIAAAVGGSASTAFRRYTAGIAQLREQLGAPCQSRK
jgi:RNA polymerase sigma-70 factor (ECF subfamily)